VFKVDELKRVGVFTRVVEAKSFSEAARQLGVAKSAVSKQVSLLEKEVGIRLLNRSTRNISLTEAGEIFYRHCQDVITRTHVALDELRQYQNQPTGTLKVSSPISFGTAHLVPVIKELRSLYPHLKIELLLEDRIINIVEEGVDLAIRIGWIQESNLVAKKLCQVPMVAFASPEYLAKMGLPKTPSDLPNHQFISLNLFKAPLRWRFEKNGKAQTVQMNSPIKSNSPDAVLSLAMAGQGISILANNMAFHQIQAGTLLPVLPSFNLEPVGIYAVYAHREHVLYNDSKSYIRLSA
jgi:DNA-binding transcriptional LysR family regulator